MKKHLIIFLPLICIHLLNEKLFSQEIPHSIKNRGIYEFIDELANNHLITINSAVKPYSRLFIAKCLLEATGKPDEMNARQQNELQFYLRDFGKEIENKRMNGRMGEGEKDTGVQEGNNDEKVEIQKPPLGGLGVKKPGQQNNIGSSLWRKSKSSGRRDLFYYKDSLFSLTVNPILGGELFINSEGKATYWRNGLEARAYIQNWGFYASLRDNHEKPLLGKPEYLTPREGGHLKGSTDWSDMKGGLTYSWKWGSAGLVKDDLEWGNNYNGANIFGGRNPSFVQLRLHIKPAKWLDFNYFHGWLNSMVVDSSRSYYVTNSYGTDYREVYHVKFIAANMFTFTPVKFLNFSAGNSIIYSDLQLFPGYMIPVFFYKSVDHTVNSGIDNMNSQMFFDISSRNVKHLHLYTALFVDELSLSRIFKDDEWNFSSWKAGFRLSDLPVSNLSLTTEYTYSYPLTYQHYVPTLTFESNGYNLGHYLRDNSREWYIAVDYRPVRSVKISFWLLNSKRGPDYTEMGTARVGNPPLVSTEWQNITRGFKASYEAINDMYTWISYTASNISGDQRWSPEYFYGKKKTINFGVSYGF